MFVIDASVWVSRYLATDRFHEASREWLSRVLPGRVPLAEPAILLPEISGAIARASGNPFAAEMAVSFVLGLPTLAIFDVDRILANDAARIARDMGLRGADAIYLALARRTSMELVSWDDEHKTRGSAVVRVHRPSELLT